MFSLNNSASGLVLLTYWLGKTVDSHFPQVTSCWLTCCWTSSNGQPLPELSSWRQWPTPGLAFDWTTSTVRGATTPWRPTDRASWLTSSSPVHSQNGYKVRRDSCASKEYVHKHKFSPDFRLNSLRKVLMSLLGGVAVNFLFENFFKNFLMES